MGDIYMGKYSDLDFNQVILPYLIEKCGLNSVVKDCLNAFRTNHGVMSAMSAAYREYELLHS